MYSKRISRYISIALCLNLLFAFMSSAEQVFDVTSAEYGATPNNSGDDDRVAFQKAIDDAISHMISTGEDAKVVLGAGTFHFDSYYPGQSYFILRIKDIDNSASLKIEGGGAILVNRIWNSEFLRIRDSSNVTVQNIIFNHDPLPYTDFIVDSVDVEKRQVHVRKVRGMDPLDMPWYHDYQHFGWLLDPTVPGRPKTGASSFYRAQSIEVNSDLGSNGYTFNMNHLGDISEFEPNDKFTYHERRGHNIGFYGSGSNNKFKWLISYASSGFMILVKGDNDTSDFEFYKVEAKIQSGKWRSLNGDGIHIEYADKMSIDSSVFQGISDDAIAFKSTTNWSVTNTKMFDKRRFGVQIVENSHNGIIKNNRASHNGGVFINNADDSSNISVSNNVDLYNGLNSPSTFVINRSSQQGKYTELTGQWYDSSLSGYESSSRYSSSEGASAEWELDVPMEGIYEVFLYKVVYPNSDSETLVTVHHDGNTSNQIVNFTEGNSGWYSLGEYFFSPGTHSGVRVERGNGHLRADSIKLVK